MTGPRPPATASGVSFFHAPATGAVSLRQDPSLVMGYESPYGRSCSREGCDRTCLLSSKYYCMNHTPSDPTWPKQPISPSVSPHNGLSEPYRNTPAQFIPANNQASFQANAYSHASFSSIPPTTFQSAAGVNNAANPDFTNSIPSLIARPIKTKPGVLSGKLSAKKTASNGKYRKALENRATSGTTQRPGTPLSMVMDSNPPSGNSSSSSVSAQRDVHQSKKQRISVDSNAPSGPGMASLSPNIVQYQLGGYSLPVPPSLAPIATHTGELWHQPSTPNPENDKQGPQSYQDQIDEHFIQHQIDEQLQSHPAERVDRFQAVASTPGQNAVGRSAYSVPQPRSSKVSPAVESRSSRPLTPLPRRTPGSEYDDITDSPGRPSPMVKPIRLKTSAHPESPANGAMSHHGSPVTRPIGPSPKGVEMNGLLTKNSPRSVSYAASTLLNETIQHNVIGPRQATSRSPKSTIPRRDESLNQAKVSRVLTDVVTATPSPSPPEPILEREHKDDLNYVFPSWQSVSRKWTDRLLQKRRLRQLNERNEPDILDQAIYSHANELFRPDSGLFGASSIRLPPRKTRPAAIFVDIDPRIHWAQPRSNKWEERKEEEIKQRQRRKGNFGKAMIQLSEPPGTKKSDPAIHASQNRQLPNDVLENSDWMAALGQLDDIAGDYHQHKAEKIRGKQPQRNGGAK